MQVLVLQEEEDLEEEQQREERVQVLHTCQVNLIVIENPSAIPTAHTYTQNTTHASILLHLQGIS